MSLHIYQNHVQIGEFYIKNMYKWVICPVIAFWLEWRSPPLQGTSTHQGTRSPGAVQL